MTNKKAKTTNMTDAKLGQQCVRNAQKTDIQKETQNKFARLDKETIKKIFTSKPTNEDLKKIQKKIDEKKEHRESATNAHVGVNPKIVAAARELDKILGDDDDEDGPAKKAKPKNKRRN